MLPSVSCQCGRHSSAHRAQVRQPVNCIIWLHKVKPFAESGPYGLTESYQTLIPRWATVSLCHEYFIALRKEKGKVNYSPSGPAWLEFEAMGQVPCRSQLWSQAPCRWSFLCSRDFISSLPDENITCSPEKYWIVFCCLKFEEMPASQKLILQLSWQPVVTVVTIKLFPLSLIAENNHELIRACATYVSWNIKSMAITFPQQADLNCNIQDDTGAFYGVTSQYESSENMTITCSTKVCSFGKQVVEKVEVGVVLRDVGRFSGSLSFSLGFSFSYLYFALIWLFLPSWKSIFLPSSVCIPLKSPCDWWHYGYLLETLPHSACGTFEWGTCGWHQCCLLHQAAEKSWSFCSHSQTQPYCSDKLASAIYILETFKAMACVLCFVYSHAYFILWYGHKGTTCPVTSSFSIQSCVFSLTCEDFTFLPF